MTDVIDRALIEAAQELLLDQLSDARQRRKQLADRSILPDATEEDEAALERQDAAVRRLELKLEACGFRMLRAEAEEQERVSAERQAARHVATVDILSDVFQRGAAVAELDDAKHAVDLAKEKIEGLTNAIKIKVSDWFAYDDPALQSFLMDIGAIGITDISNELSSPHRLAPGLALTRSSALRALAKALPGAVDKAVQDEARAAAKAAIAEADAGQRTCP